MSSQIRINDSVLLAVVCVLSLTIAFPTTSAAALITPIDVGSAMNQFPGRPKINTINDSGIGAPTSGGFDTHGTSVTDMWLTSTATPGSIVFDLGAVYDVDDVVLWNYYEGTLGRGVDEFSLDFFDASNSLISSTGSFFATDPSLVSGRIPAETGFLGSSVSGVNKVRMNIDSNHGDVTYTGLAEVKFDGTFVSAVTPPIGPEELISPIDATSAGGEYPLRPISATIDRMGINEADPLTTDHTHNTAHADMWLSPSAVSYPNDLTFTLDDDYDLDGMAMWAYNEGQLGRAIQQFDLIFLDESDAIITTINDLLGTNVGVSGYDLGGIAGTGELRGGLEGRSGTNAEIFRFSTVEGAKKVIVRIDSGYPGENFSGLAEIGFLGELTPPPVPEPSSFLLLGLGALGFVRHTRRQRRADASASCESVSISSNSCLNQRSEIMFNSQLCAGIVTLVVFVLVCVNSASATFIDIQNTVGLGDTVINSTDNTGTNDAAPYGPESATRDEDQLINGTILSGSPLSLSSSGADPNYWNSSSAAGTAAMLIDLGQPYFLDAIQLYGYNISDGSGSFAGRSLASFTVWTATAGSAVTTGGGSLLVNDLGQFTQQGVGQTMAAVTNSATFGETYLFGGASQPSDVSGTTHNVTGDPVLARYLFLRDMQAHSGGNIGLGEIRVYGIEPPPVPEPSTIMLLGLGALGLFRHARRRKRANR